ncbi:MAG: SPOR domain-containing protein [Myxococcaceae bacterium]|jgi:DedD protein|nr:SPOR domain-containing protein [Myxococcaceae bacterium]MCA3015285.1 SPOR domain-containing protein [Myxococcaceae bacterium]
MRDSHRLKEKYELSLDSRQIVTLTVSSIVVLGGVFVLGVVVGKKLANETQKLTQPQDILSTVDRKTEALALAEKQPAPLTFQEELTRKPADVPVEPPKPPAPKPAEVKRPESAAEPEAAPSPSGREAVAAAEPKPEPRPPPEGEPRLPETPRAEPVTTRTNDAGALKEAFGKIARQEPVAPTTDGAWTVQLSAYQDKAEADRFAAGLRDKGYAPFIVEAQVPGKGVWYRVRLGRFASKEAASSYLGDFKRETSISGIVTSN